MPFLHEIRKSPFLRILLPFLAGIIVALYFPPLHIVVVCMDLVSVILLLPALFVFSKKYSQEWLSGISVNVALFSLGISVFYLHSEELSACVTCQPAEYTECEVLDQVTAKPHSYYSRLAIRDSNTTETINAYFEKDSLSATLEPGEIILAKINPAGIEGPRNPYEFNYARYCRFNGITRQAYIRKIQWVKTGRTSLDFRTFFLRIRKSLIGKYQMYQISGDDLGILSALTFGYTGDVSRDVLNSFSATGTVHILSVSGLHVGIVYILLGFIFGWLGRLRNGDRFKVVAVIAGVWFYAALAGFIPAVTRAAVMFSFVEAGKLFRRSMNPMNSLAASAFFILVTNPFAVTDIGFQLSYLAVGGIFIIYKPLYNLYIPKYPVADKIWALLCVSFAAQLATFPLSMYYFHNFPILFLVTNLLIVPYSSVILYAALFFLPLSFIPVAGRWCALLLQYSVAGLRMVTEWLSRLSCSHVSSLNITLAEMILLYLLFILLILFFLKKRYAYLRNSLLVLLVFVLYHFTDRIISGRRAFVTVYSVKGKSVTGIYSCGQGYLIGDTIPAEMAEHHIRDHWIRENIATVTHLNHRKDTSIIEGSVARVFDHSAIICLRDRKFLFLNDSLLPSFSTEKKISFTAIIISNTYRGTLRKLTTVFATSRIILDSSVGTKKRKMWRKESVQNNIQCSEAGERAIVLSAD